MGIPPGGRGVRRAVLGRPQRPLAFPVGSAWTCAAAPPAFWSVWRHRCGRCRPPSIGTSKFPSAGADGARRPQNEVIAKKKQGFRQFPDESSPLRRKPMEFILSAPHPSHNPGFGGIPSPRNPAIQRPFLLVEKLKRSPGSQSASALRERGAPFRTPPRKIQNLSSVNRVPGSVGRSSGFAGFVRFSRAPCSIAQAMTPKIRIARITM